MPPVCRSSARGFTLSFPFPRTSRPTCFCSNFFFCFFPFRPVRGAPRLTPRPAKYLCLNLHSIAAPQGFVRRIQGPRLGESFVRGLSSLPVHAGRLTSPVTVMKFESHRIQPGNNVQMPMSSTPAPAPRRGPYFHSPVSSHPGFVVSSKRAVSPPPPAAPAASNLAKPCLLANKSQQIPISFSNVARLGHDHPRVPECNRESDERKGGGSRNDFFSLPRMTISRFRHASLLLLPSAPPRIDRKKYITFPAAFPANNLGAQVCTG